MLIGNGPTDLHRVSMVGNDLALDNGIGTCGKNGQGVPVGVGQPTLRIDRITVGGRGIAPMADLVPAIHVSAAVIQKSWMPATSAGMTMV